MIGGGPHKPVTFLWVLARQAALPLLVQACALGQVAAPGLDLAKQ